MVSILSCTSEITESNNSLENQFLNETKYAPIQIETDNYEIKYGYSFGECIGFCQSQIEFTSEGILQTRLRWSDNKEIIEYYSIDDSIYNELISSINYKEFIDFNENLGCGDCADGGSEWLEIKNDTEKRNLNGTYGFQAPCVGELLSFLRTVNQSE